MEQLINTIASDRLVLAIVLLLLALAVYFILKRLVKLIIIAVIMLVLFTGFMYYRGEKLPAPVKELIQQGEKTKDTINRINRAADILKDTEGMNQSSKGSSRGSSSE